MNDWRGQQVNIAPSLLGETYEQLRTCGQGRRECHVVWVASWAEPNRILRIVHPTHMATAVSVEIDVPWLNAFFLELSERGECIRVQVHSHPGNAFHSSTDDRWPVIRAPGFLSLVIPDFASGHVDLEDAYLAEQGADGDWSEADVRERMVVAAMLAQ